MPLLGARTRTQGLGTTSLPSPSESDTLSPPPKQPQPRLRVSLPLLPQPSLASALGEPGWGVTRRPLGAEEAPVRRLRAPDKSGAGDSSAVSMEERETEEVGGTSSRKNAATVSAASLPPYFGVKSCRCRRCSCRRCLLYFSWSRGRISPPVGHCAGRGVGITVRGGD
nr:uncharacterized protein LOC120365386 [Saimiri boliviensis boliviensis]